MTQLTVPFVLPDDILLTPVAQLPSEARAKLDAPDADVAITRPRSRTASSVVDADFAALLERFRSSRTIVDAVVDFSRERQADPRTVLASAFPVLQRLIRSGLLLPAEDERARTIAASFEIGDRIGDFEILRRISLLHDVELYQARSTSGTVCILKIARQNGGAAIRSALAREAVILQVLDGLCAPRLLAECEREGAPYLAIEWCAGVRPTVAASEFRATGNRRGLLDLCVQIARAYETLHGAAIIHGDVHDRNLLVGQTGAVTIVDFGLARTLDSKRGPRRSGVWLYYDPELAGAMLADRTPAPPTIQTDQYALGALLFTIVTGHPYLDFSIRREKALTQITSDPPLSFEGRGVPPWPELEPVLHRMLSKNPADRFASMSDVVESLRGTEPSTALHPANATPGHSIERAMFERLSIDGPLYRSGLPSTPLCGVNLGASGIALAWYRLSIARDDPNALASAIAWGQRAMTLTTEPEAFYTADLAISPKNVGRVSLSHTMSGLHCVRTLIALAGGDFSEAERWTAAYERATKARYDNPDLTLGRAGLLLGCAMIDEASPRPNKSIRALGDRLAAWIARRVDGAGPIARSTTITNAGIAHGWAGILYALMRWSVATRTPLPSAVVGRVAEMTTLARHDGRGLSWPREIGTGQSDPIPSWCNGDAGFVFFWLYAAQALEEPSYVDLAEQTAWNVWDTSTDAVTHLCCGLAGRSYSLLALHRQTGAPRWLDRAKRLASRAASLADPDTTDAHSLYRGALGVALLVAELEDPRRARMPFFEPEGWQWHRSQSR